MVSAALAELNRRLADAADEDRRDSAGIRGLDEATECIVLTWVKLCVEACDRPCRRCNVDGSGSTRAITLLTRFHGTNVARPGVHASALQDNMVYTDGVTAERSSGVVRKSAFALRITS